jgi:hypothetical protein
LPRSIDIAGSSPGRPDTLTNAILAGTLLEPLGLVGRRQRFSADALERRDRARFAAHSPA